MQFKFWTHDGRSDKHWQQQFDLIDLLVASTLAMAFFHATSNVDLNGRTIVIVRNLLNCEKIVN